MKRPLRNSAVYVDKIPRDARPAELPVQQRTRFDSASTSGPRRRSTSRFPPSVLTQADALIP